MKAQSEAPLLTITVTTNSDTRRYGPQAEDAAQDTTIAHTLSALRHDIMQGDIPREAKAKFETKKGNANPQIVEGTLFKCASQYPVLADLYTPVHRHARSGMGYGILIGILLNILLLVILVCQTDDTAGMMILALLVGPVLLWLNISSKVKIPNIILTPCLLATAFVIPGYLGLNGLFPMLLGAAFSGGLLGSMSGMTVGAFIGAIRRPQLPRAYDAPHENATLRVAIPLAISVALWAANILLARTYLSRVAPTATAANIFVAAGHGELKTVRALLKENPDLVHSADTSDNGWGNTPLHLAAGNCYQDVAELLIANKADVNARGSDGGTPLHRAADGGCKNTAELLLANKADIGAKDSDGQTPLHRAAGECNAWAGRANDCKSVVELLLAHGAEVNAEDSVGKTPLQEGVGPKYNKDIVEMLRQHGAHE